jgi:uncharacterized protein
MPFQPAFPAMERTMRALLFALTLIISLLPDHSSAADRVALVIGIGSYRHVTPLKNAVNDAVAIAHTLKSIGFDVTELTDAPRADLARALGDFTFRAETADLALIYFAGHGVEVQGENFLIPVDADVRSNQDIQRQSVSLKDFLAAVDSARKMRVVILDSCRDNPFPDSLRFEASVEAEGARVVGRGGGLAAPSPDRGTLVAYAARDGQVALDGQGDHSPFAIALSEKLAVPGLEISLMFRQVRDEVLARTDNLQEPHIYGSLPGVPYYLAGPAELRDGIAVADKTLAWSQLRPEQADQLQALATSGDARAMLGLAMIMLNPASQRYAPDAAGALLARSAAAESPEAQYELAKLYEKGIGVPENLDRALELYQAASSKDFPDAVNDIGYYYYTGGLGLPIDQNEALKYFLRAADLKQPEALLNVASFIDKGFIAGRGPDDAAAYLYQSLRAGSHDALDALSTQPEYFGSETWRALQVRLSSNGFYNGAADGVFGPGTVRALRAAFGLLEKEG